MFKRIFCSEQFLGKGKSNYFEGWYFKVDGEFPFSFVVGVSKNKSDPHSFVQYIDSTASHIFRFHLKDFSFSKENLTIKVQNNVFSLKGLDIDILRNGTSIKAKVEFADVVPFKKSLFAPSVMGPFSYLPLFCMHALVSLHHKASGVLSVNGKEKTILGLGYIEKDFGTRFPKNYIWLHASNNETSLTVAVAWPLIFGIRGFLCVLYCKGKQYNFSTYSGAKLKKFCTKDQNLHLILQKGKCLLEIEVNNNDFLQTLIAPSKDGKMNVKIKENLLADFASKLVLDGKKVDLDDIKHCTFESVIE